jgi:ABC-type Zn2+ transport system substrate-binding protein/surface adhesin
MPILQAVLMQLDMKMKISRTMAACLIAIPRHEPKAVSHVTELKQNAWRRRIDGILAFLPLNSLRKSFFN